MQRTTIAAGLAAGLAFAACSGRAALAQTYPGADRSP